MNILFNRISYKSKNYNEPITNKLPYAIEY